MISEEKMIHIVHLLLDGLKRHGMVEYPNELEAVREGKRVCVQFVSQMAACGDLARARILSQKNPPPEQSPQWNNLYNKYYEEELRKREGANPAGGSKRRS